MPSPLEKLAKMKALAESVGASRVAAAPAHRPVDMNRLRAMQNRAEETVAQELKRIVSLPIAYVPTDEDVEALSQHYFQSKAFNEGWRLLRSQAEGLLAYNETEGGFLPLAVGGGKTLLSLLIANDAYQSGKHKIMLIVPSALAEQLCETDIKHWRPLTIFNTPVHRLTGLSPTKRRALAQSGRKGIYIFTYDLLSRDYQILTDVSPDLLICDEAHSVSKRSARTRRFNQYLHEAAPQVVALSGTMTQKSLMDYFELARAALGKSNFLPNSLSLTEELSKLIDVTATSVTDFKNERDTNTGPLKYWLKWANEKFPAEEFESSVVGMRKAFQRRLTTCPGVVCSSGHDLPYSLYIFNEPVDRPEQYEGWDKVQALVKKLDDEWLTPNGDEIEEAMHLFRWKYWIQGAGFYTERYWPETEWMMEHGKYSSLNEAVDILERSKIFHVRHMEYARELRSWITERARTGLDTPMLIGKDMSLYGEKNVGATLFHAWRYWKEAEFEGRIERNSRAIRVCDFKIQQAIRWAKAIPKGEGGLIWYDNDEMGEWLNERMIAEGREPLFAKAGKSYNELLANRDLCKGKIIILTSNAHFQGKNLQFDRNQFYLQWPRSAARAEQAIGRQHRVGLEYDEVFVTTCSTTEFDKIQFGATLNDAAYVHQTQGNQQKLIYATYKPKPEIVPFEVLREWGAQPERLDAKAQEMLNRRFK